MTDISKTPTLTELNDTFTVGALTYTAQLEEDLYVNRSDLQNEFVTHPARFAFYATCYELASINVQHVENALKRLYASLDHEKRGELLTAGIKVTEKMIENSVITDDRYVALQDELLTAEKNAAMLKVAMLAMIQRKDLLVQLGSAMRAEMQADLAVKAAATTAGTR